MKNLLLTLLVTTGLTGCFGCGEDNSKKPFIPPDPVACPSTDSTKPNLLIIGDSISIGYFAPLASKLVEYNVVHNLGNAESSFNTRNKVDQFLTECGLSYDVIVWNNGVWDSTKVEINEERNATDAEYTDNLTFIAGKLTSTGARVMFMTTTVIEPADSHNSGREDELNDIARNVLPGLGVEVHELNALSRSLDRYDFVHYDYPESLVLASFIANKVRGN